MVPFTFRQLEVFICAAENGSFRACADQLAISQVSVGEHIRSLEQQLGWHLFDRRRGRLPVLTTRGETVLRQAKELLASAAQLAMISDPVGRSPSHRRLRIGAHGFIAETLAPTLADFAARHPRLDIELQKRSFANTVEGIASSEIEIGYFLARGPVPEFDSALAWEEPMAFFAGPTHPLAKRTGISADQLSGQPFVYLPARTALRQTIDGILRDLGITNCPAILTSDDHALIVETLASGRGIGCLFADHHVAQLAGGRLVRLDLAMQVPPVQVRYAVRTPYRSDLTASALLAALNGCKSEV